MRPVDISNTAYNGGYNMSTLDDGTLSVTSALTVNGGRKPRTRGKVNPCTIIYADGTTRVIQSTVSRATAKRRKQRIQAARPTDIQLMQNMGSIHEGDV